MNLNEKNTIWLESAKNIGPHLDPILSSKRIQVYKKRVTIQEESKTGIAHGLYYTISCNLREVESLQEEILEIMKQILKIMIPKKNKISFLFVGLGNEQILCDSLGPKTAKKINIVNQPNLHSYSISPGVYGTTGMETASIIKGISEEIHPDAIIVFDSLAASSYERLESMIQIHTAGIKPGGGIGSKRKSIQTSTVKSKVISIGIPSVLDLRVLLHSLNVPLKEEKKYDFLMTSKDVDVFLERMSYLLSDVWNLFLLSTKKEEEA